MVPRMVWLALLGTGGMTSFWVESDSLGITGTTGVPDDAACDAADGETDAVAGGVRAADARDAANGDDAAFDAADCDLADCDAADFDCVDFDSGGDVGSCDSTLPARGESSVPLASATEAFAASGASVERKK